MHTPFFKITNTSSRIKYFQLKSRDDNSKMKLILHCSNKHLQIITIFLYDSFTRIIYYLFIYLFHSRQLIDEIFQKKYIEVPL